MLWDELKRIYSFGSSHKGPTSILCSNLVSIFRFSEPLHVDSTWFPGSRFIQTLQITVYFWLFLSHHETEYRTLQNFSYNLNWSSRNDHLKFLSKVNSRLDLLLPTIFRPLPVIVPNFFLSHKFAYVFFWCPSNTSTTVWFGPFCSKATIKNKEIVPTIFIDKVYNYDMCWQMESRKDRSVYPNT